MSRPVRRSVTAAVAAISLAALLTGCFGTVVQPQQPPAEPAPTDETPSIDTEALIVDLDTAVSITDAFWEKHWEEFFTGVYSSPTVVGLYDGRDAASAPQCGGSPLGPNNAFYCSDGDFVAWDVSLMTSGYEIGDAWAYLVVAHEWGHAIQARLDGDLVSAQQELQADCLAGAALFGAASDGLVSFEQGDQAEIATSLSSLGDETAWTDSGDHGDPFERIDFFDRGRQDGVPACFPTE